MTFVAVAEIRSFNYADKNPTGRSRGRVNALLVGHLQQFPADIGVGGFDKHRMAIQSDPGSA